MVNRSTAQPASGGVQSVRRALNVIESVAAHGGHLAVAEIAALCDLPQPTTHRLLQTLVDCGYMRQLSDRRYALGARLIPLGTASSRLLASDSTAVLANLVEAIGESANLAVLSGDHAEYVAQVPSTHSMRMFTEVGRRVELHSTGVGKAMLAQLDPARALAIVRRVGMTGYTEHTITEESVLMADLEQIRERGYAIDEEEQEHGVRCVAVAVPDAIATWSAVSVSGPLTRMTPETVEGAVPLLQRAARELQATAESNPT